MKKIILVLIGLGLCVQAKCEYLYTTDLNAYYNVTSQRVDPDGLLIEYTLPGGGLGMAKVKFSRLNADLQKQYGYDPAKAKDYEAKVVKATDDFRQEAIRLEQTGQAQRLAQQALEDQREKGLTDRILAMAQLKQSEADLVRATGSSENSGYGWAGGGYGGYGGYGGGGSGFGSGFGFVRARTDFNPVVTPVPFPQLNTPDFSRPISSDDLLRFQLSTRVNVNNQRVNQPVIIRSTQQRQGQH